VKNLQIDYTHYPRGKTSIRGTKISRCPKCGRRGEYCEGQSKAGRYAPDRFIHKLLLTPEGKPATFEVTDACYLRIELTPEARTVIQAALDEGAASC
jgi:hypothetical protein